MVDKDKSQRFWEQKVLPALIQVKQNGKVRETAKAIGCHEQTLYKYLHGERGKNVSFAMLKKVARGLGFSEGEIISNTFDKSEKAAMLMEHCPDLVEYLHDAVFNQPDDDIEQIAQFLRLAARRKAEYSVRVKPPEKLPSS